DLRSRPARLPPNRKHQNRTSIGTRIELAQLPTLTSDDRRVGQTDQAHGRARVLGIAVFFHVPREHNILPVRRNISTINVSAILAGDKPSILPVRVGHPKLGPAVAMILRLTRWAV